MISQCRTRAAGGISRRIKLGISALLLAAAMATARSAAQEEHKFTFDVGAGVSPLVGEVSTNLDNGWHVVADGGYNFTSRISTSLEYTYNGYGVSSKTLSEAQVPGGNAHMWSITVDPKLRLMHGHKIDPYVAGGVGYYRRTIEFTSPSLVPVFFFDPFFGVFFNTLVTANRVLGDITKGGIGGSAGAGFDVKLGESGVKFFSEARYHYAATGSVPTRMVPVTFGLRW